MYSYGPTHMAKQKQDDQLEHKYIFTNPSPRVGYNTRSIFKLSLTGLNSEFPFS